jgi:hypothetical protein
MAMVSIPDLYARLNELLEPAFLDLIEMKVAGESGLVVKIDGERCLTSIGVWPTGCCDVDFLFISSEQGEFRHLEFQDTDSAVEPVLNEIVLASERR